MEFTKKNILITGSSSGIGEALAEKLSNYECNLFILARRLEKLNSIAEKLNEKKAQIFPIFCDVADKSSVDFAYEKILEKVDVIDIAILNSGIAVREKVENFSSDDVELTFGVNLFGIVYWVEKLLPKFLEKNSGSIIGVSSLADNRGFSGSGAYSASKAAATIYLEGLRTDLKPYGIQVITVKPGFVKTPMTDKNDFYMPFLMSSEKSADIIIKGLKRDKSMIRFPKLTSIGSTFIGLWPSKLYELVGRKLS